MSDTEKIRKLIATQLAVEVKEVTNEVDLKTLVQDSFALVELVMTLQEDLVCRIFQEDLVTVTTAGDLISVFSSKLKG